MLNTIQSEKVEALFEKYLKEYSQLNGKSIIGWTVDAGIVVGLLKIAQELDGFPPEKLAAYKLRVNAIGDLACNKII